MVHTGFPGSRYFWVHGTFLSSVPEHILGGIPRQRGGEPVFNIDNACTCVAGKEGDRVRIKIDAEHDRCEGQHIHRGGGR